MQDEHNRRFWAVVILSLAAAATQVVPASWERWAFLTLALAALGAAGPLIMTYEIPRGFVRETKARIQGERRPRWSTEVHDCSPWPCIDIWLGLTPGVRLGRDGPTRVSPSYEGIIVDCVIETPTGQLFQVEGLETKWPKFGFSVVVPESFGMESVSNGRYVVRWSANNKKVANARFRVDDRYGLMPTLVQRWRKLLERYRKQGKSVIDP